jgi:hypothetical protein
MPLNYVSSTRLAVNSLKPASRSPIEMDRSGMAISLELRRARDTAIEFTDLGALIKDGASTQTNFLSILTRTNFQVI